MVSMDIWKMMIMLVVVLMGKATATATATGKEELSSSEEVMMNWAGYGEDKLSTVVIHGNLLCHASFDKKLPTHPSPVAGATVAVLCGRSGKTKKSWARGSSDSHGQFIIDLPSHLHAIPNLEKICLVKVLHLPKSSPCRHAFTGKHKAIELTSIGEGIRTYTTHNIHLMPKPSSKQQHIRQGPKRERKTFVL